MPKKPTDNSKPLFTAQDVKVAQHILTRLLRQIIYRKGYTVNNYYEMHRRLAKYVGMSKSLESSDRSNAMRILAVNAEDEWQPTTFNSFVYMIQDIMNQDVEITIKLTDRKTGEVLVVGQNDPV